MDMMTVLGSIETITNHIKERKYNIFDFVIRAYTLDENIYILKVQTEKGIYSIDTLHGIAIYNNRKENKILQLTKQQNDYIRWGYTRYRRA